ncbi:MAG TPA: tetratricopeptide repeat protein [Blastocatellia bacterium]|nr:tetratricopeptide repeat protein [Blastocatellia bacterium]
MLNDLRLLIALLWQPTDAARQIRDRAPVAFAFIAAWVATTLYFLVLVIFFFYATNGRRAPIPEGDRVGSVVTQSFAVVNLQSAAISAVMTVLFIAAIYVPTAIFFGNLWDRRGSFSLVLRDEYAATAACTLSSWAGSLLVAVLPTAIIGWQSSQSASGAVVGYTALALFIPLPIFAALTTISIAAIFRIGWLPALVTMLLSSLSLVALPLLMSAARFICASPFLALLVLFLLRDRVDDFIGAQRSRQSLKQNLQAATLNPADASAHYQLGLIYQQQGERDNAIAAFRRAVEIDPSETDAHYQLGRLAREQGHLDESINYFDTVVRQAPAHSQHEIWREIALTYSAAGQHADALNMLDRFLNHRPSDAEGRYWRGMTLFSLGRMEEAEAEMKTCIESVRTAPAYKYRTEKRWLHLAQNFLRERQA